MSKNIRYFILLIGVVFIFSIGFIAGKGNNRQVLSDSAKPYPTLYPQTPAQSTSNQKSGLYSVVKVIDGDTIDVSIDGKTETLRLIGIDTPETVDPRKPVQCFGIEASNKAKSILTGKKVRLESDVTQGNLDKYKRLLRYVFLEDGTDFNLLMISEGFAHEYTYNLPYKYQSEFRKAEKQAREKEVGLWSPNSCGGNTTVKASNSTTEIIQETSTSSGQSVGSDYKPTGTYVCDCSKLCSQIKTCDEAYYQLQNCGCSVRDSDGDGVPCESLCR